MTKTLIKSLSLVSSMTLISRVLGLVRDTLAAQLFGVNAGVDAFIIAFKIPNFMRNLFAEGSFSQAFVPVLSEYQQSHSKEAIRVFINHMAGSLGLILLALTFLGVFWAQYLIELFSPGLDLYRFNLARDMLRITFPYLMLISLTAFMGSILNSYGKFGIPAFSPALLNICLIITALGFSNWFHVPVESQAWGVLIAGFVQFFLQLFALYRMGVIITPKISWKDEGVKRVLKLIIPGLFGASVGQISILLSTVLASFLVTGSITWLYYSERLTYFPLGVFGVALATVTLPHLSRQYASNSDDEFSTALDWGLRLNLLIGIPASVAMFMLSGPLIVSLFQYGKFTLNDVLMTQQCVVTYAVGLQAFMLAKMLSSAFYARQDIRTPVRISMITLGANMVLSLILVWPLAHAGLALATSLSSWVNVIILWVTLQKRGIYSPKQGWLYFVLQLIVANTVLAGFLWYSTANTLTWMHWNWSQRFLHLLMLGSASLALYLVCLWLTRLKQIDLAPSVNSLNADPE